MNRASLTRTVGMSVLLTALLLAFAGAALAGSIQKMQFKGEVVDVFLPDPAPLQLLDGGKMLTGTYPVITIADPSPPPGQKNIFSPYAKARDFDFEAAKKAASATFDITYLAAGQTDLQGETCSEFPAQARTAFDAAASVWGSLLSSSVPITVTACWANLGSSSTLGYSSSPSLRDFTNAPQVNTWYDMSLASAFAGTDVAASYGYDHIYITYNSNFSWYYGTDGNTPSGQYDFMSVVLHEIAHGLNFAGMVTYISPMASTYGDSTNGFPSIWEKFMYDGTGTALTSYQSPSQALSTLLTSNSLWWKGSNAMAANSNNAVQMYAPSTWADGSSYSHLDYDAFSTTEDRLMVYAIGSGTATHSPGPVIKGILKDVGWTVSGNGTTSGNNTVYMSHLTGGQSGWTDILVADNDTASSADFTITLYASGAQVYSGSHSVAARDQTTVNLKTLASNAESGIVTFDEPSLTFRLSFASSAGGVAEFMLPSTKLSTMGLYFSGYSPTVDWKGLAIANWGSSTASVTLYAIGNGSVLGSTTVSIGANDRTSDVVENYFTGLSASSIEKVVATTTSADLTGIVISGSDTLDKLLFTNGAELTSFSP